MSYIAHSLSHGEELLYKARFPWFYRAGAWAALVVLAGAGVVAYGYDYPWAALILALAGIMSFITILLPTWTSEIGVTNQRFIYKRGLIWRKTQELQLRAVEEVTLEQGVLGRLFDFGRIELRGTGVDDIRLPELADPVGLRRAMQAGINAASQATASAPGTPLRPRPAA
ncbi:MAG TPA: PH domain-containing protein [Hyphomicrobiaceae bacterium]|nr:PH domain-containing protein [Hyphomicrobiaceae bacterium]